MNKTLKTILIFAGAGLILFLMYAFFLQPAPSAGTAVTGGLITVSTTGTAEDPGSVGIVSLLASMQKIQLDRALFASQLYQSLHDFGVTIAAEPYGKDDPFAAIGGSGDSSGAQSFAPAPSRKAAH